MTAWFLTTDSSGVASLTLDCPGSRLNIISNAVFQEFDSVLSELAARKDIKGLLILSAKADNFIAGADIEEFLKLTTAEQATEGSRQAQRVFQKLQDLPFPKVAAIHGPCLGGGLELVLPCDARVASDSPKTTFAAPEVKLGILPGAGGTQRLPRVVGLAAALDLNLSGRIIGSRQALSMGLVNVVAPRESLEEAARQELTRLQEHRPEKPLPLFRRLTRLLLEENTVGRLYLYKKAEEGIAKAGRHYPAPRAVLDAMKEGIEQDSIAGFKAESRGFGQLAVTDVSRELIGLFFATNEAKKDPGASGPDATPAKIDQVDVVGSGFMGAGIAQVLAERGSSVRLHDIDSAMLGKALAGCRKAFDEKAKRKRMTPQEHERALDRLSASVGPAGAHRSSLLIEAVFEDLELKRKVLREYESFLPPRAIFASNTSSIPIADIASASSRPEQVVGMHFFSPVPKMPLLEVIITPKTAPWVTATAVACGKKMGKTVIVVRDRTGFFTSRVLAFYLNEAALLVEEGGDIATIDRAMADFGFPVGPFLLLDEVGLDIGAHVTRVMACGFGDRLKIAETFARILDDGRRGKKNGRGFYLYGKGKKKSVDPSVYGLLPGGTARRTMDAEEIRRRLWLTFAAECVRCLEEEVLQRPRDGDLGAVMGLGFPAFLGGPFRLMDRHGLQKVVRDLEQLARVAGDRHAPPQLLKKLAAEGGRFHGSG